MQPYAFSSSSCLRPIIALNHDYYYGLRTISPGLHAKSRKGFFKESQGAGYNMITMCVWFKTVENILRYTIQLNQYIRWSKCHLAKSISVDLSGQRSAGRSWTPPVVRHMCFVDLVEPAAPLWVPELHCRDVPRALHEGASWLICGFGCIWLAPNGVVVCVIGFYKTPSQIGDCIWRQPNPLRYQIYDCKKMFKKPITPKHGIPNWPCDWV